MRANATPRDLLSVFRAVERLIAATDRFVEPWGVADTTMLAELRSFAGGALPAEYEGLLLRWGNLNLGYTQINGLGPLDGLPAVQLLTRDRRSEWAVFPADALALGEDGTDLYVLRMDGSVEVRSESGRDLPIHERYSSFAEFLAASVDRAVEGALELGKLPKGFRAWG